MEYGGCPSICLDGDEWTLSGYQPNAWRLGKSKELGAHQLPVLPQCPARVPGAVQLDLMRAGRLPDFNAGLNARSAEWVEHCEWIYSRDVMVPEGFAGKRILLEFDGLDYSGAVAVDGAVVGTFEGTHVAHTFDVTSMVQPGGCFTLSVLFDPPPNLPGQIGFTQAVRQHKPRFNYGWDWIARTVSIGIWQSVRLSARGEARFDGISVTAAAHEGGGSGEVRLRAELAQYSAGQAIRVEWRLAPKAGSDAADLAGSAWVVSRNIDISFTVPNPMLWWPAGQGAQSLYDLHVTLVLDGAVQDHRTFTVGFKHAQWVTNPGAPPDALPSLLVLNGHPLYLRGVNWVPLSPFPGGPREEDYRSAIATFKAMGTNLLRVWGGGILERAEFYRACDEAGILVWQEFPLSSSGCSDYPPDDPETVQALSRIAQGMVRLRGHHASHLMWDGGNELAKGFDGTPTGRDVPIDEGHPLIAEFSRVVKLWDPGKKFIPTSGHGPRAFGFDGDFGKGVHHDVHGHWAYLGPESHYRYYNNDDALWRSEVGVPGSTSGALMRRFSGGLNPWPPNRTNPLWLQHGAWWIGWETMTQAFGAWDEGISEVETYLSCSRYLQMEGYRYVLEACRRRALACSLNTIWMGRDCFWTTSNNSVVEVDGSCKPAWSACQRAFGRLKVCLRYGKSWAMPGEALDATIWALCDGDGGAPQSSGRLTAALRGGDGAVHEQLSAEVQVSPNGSTKLWELNWTPDADAHGLLFVELSLVIGDAESRDTYILGQSPEAPFAALRNLASTELEVTVLTCESSAITVRVRNIGGVAAAMVELATADSPGRAVTQGSAVTIFPGEAAVISAEPVLPSEALPSLEVRAINAAPIRLLV